MSTCKVGRYCLISWGAREQKGTAKESASSVSPHSGPFFLLWASERFCTPKSRLPGLQPQGKNCTVSSLGCETFEYGFRHGISIPGSLACMWPSLGRLSPHHDLRKFYPINSFSYHSFYVYPIFLFLWRTLTNSYYVTESHVVNRIVYSNCRTD